MVNLITDLDSTLIYSKHPNHKIVEYYEGRPITFMTQKAFDTLERLVANPNFQLIPCTLRSFEQTMRVEFLQKNMPKYMICDDGASIYVNGVLDNAYQEYLNANNILKTDLVAEMKAILENATGTYVKDNRMSFLVVIYPCHETAIFQADYVKKLMKDYPVMVERQGRKVYVLPHGLGKEVAVQYLKDVHNVEPTFTSGDGFVDEKFVKMGVNPLVPGHAYFEHENKMKTTGIMAGENILTKIEEVVFNG